MGYRFEPIQRGIQSEKAPHAPIATGKGLQTIRLEETRRGGGADRDVIFGHGFRAEADADGNVHLLNTQLSEVPVLSPDGELLRPPGREGEEEAESEDMGWWPAAGCRGSGLPPARRDG